MLETEFIKKNSEKWLEYEKLLSRGINNPDKLSEIYLNLSDDLSFANTHYANRAVRLYLNNLTQKVYNSINTDISRLSIKSVFTKYLPEVFYHTRNAMLFTIIVFAIGVAIGSFSTINDPDFVRISLGEQYVQQTIINMETGDPMAIYRDHNDLEGFWSIFVNNGRIAVNTFLLGFIGGVGSLFFLLVNAIMVGSFQTFFFQRGIIGESFFTIWTHGTIEFLAMFFACAAGFHLGASFLFPKTYTRLQSLQIASKRSLFLITISAILVLLAAYIETYITGLDLPNILRAFFIIIPILIFVYSIFLYPKLLVNKNSKIFERAETLSPNIEQSISLENLSSKTEIFVAIVHIYLKNISKFMLLALVIAFVFTSIILGDLDSVSEIEGPSFLIEEFLVALPWWLRDLSINIIALYAYFILSKQYTQSLVSDNEKTNAILPFSKILGAIIIVLVNELTIYLFMSHEEEYGFFLIYPLIFSLGVKLFMYPAAKFSIKEETIKVYGFNLAVLLLLILIMLCMNYILNMPVLNIISQIITLLIPMSESMTSLYVKGFGIFTLFFLLFILLPIIYIALGTNTAVVHELKNGTLLLKRIDNIKTKTKRYGMEGEL